MTAKKFKEAWLDLWDALISLVGINLMWFILTILVIPAFPAFGGLYYATNQIAHGESADLSTFFEGFKKYFWISWKLGLINLFTYFLLIMNIWFYGQFEGFGYLIIQSVFFSLTLIYTCMQIYIFPFVLEQDDPSIKIAFRNSFSAFVSLMGRTFGLLLLFIVMAAISILLPPLWLLVTMSVIVYFSNWHTLYAIAKLRQDASEREDNPDSN